MDESGESLLQAFDAFVQEHRRCGTIDGSSERRYVWLSCSCSGFIVRVLDQPFTRIRIDQGNQLPGRAWLGHNSQSGWFPLVIGPRSLPAVTTRAWRALATQ
jgi:hypothetical protein